MRSLRLTSATVALLCAAVAVLAAALSVILTPEGAAAQRADFATLMARLAVPGESPSDAAAGAVLTLLQKSAGEHLRA